MSISLVSMANSREQYSQRLVARQRPRTSSPWEDSSRMCSGHRLHPPEARGSPIPSCRSRAAPAASRSAGGADTDRPARKLYEEPSVTTILAVQSVPVRVGEGVGPSIRVEPGSGELGEHHYLAEKWISQAGRIRRRRAHSAPRRSRGERGGG